MPQQTQAVAIEWAGDDEVPFVSAAGQGIDASSIIEVAINAHVPIFENPLLMEDLAILQQNDSIPRHLFVAVAQILAFIKYMQGELRSPENPSDDVEIE